MKVVTVVGARPQFIKAAAVSRAISERYSGDIREIIVHTGQHYDDSMSQVFFDELSIPRPEYNLQVAGGSHGAMTGRMLESLETVLLKETPDVVLIYGDTNSTLAGVLAAAKLHIPTAHVEAGLRSFNMRMPEEVNRVVADRLATVLFCPTRTAVQNLRSEGIVDRVYDVGDVMYDVALFYRNHAARSGTILEKLSLGAGGYALATCHRAENTDDRKRLAAVLGALRDVSRDLPVVLPLHPRTRKLIQEHGLAGLLDHLVVTEPLGFLEMVALEQSARIILTDSGGVQKEAFFYGVPCVTMREETEWVETVESGWNRLAPPGSADIPRAVAEALATVPGDRPAPYGDGKASHAILRHLIELHESGFSGGNP
jgi:UDP-GlcNAc3NAcA epimerase